MKLKLDENWTTTNNGYPLNDAEVARYNAVLPSQRQILQSQNPFYCFIHYGMNTATGREWGNATETLRDFDITKIKPTQWSRRLRRRARRALFSPASTMTAFAFGTQSKPISML